MSWNYRVVKHTSENFGVVEDYYKIHEVFYNKSGNIHLWSDSVEPHGLSKEELKQDLHMMLEAFDKPILMFANNMLVECD